MKQEKDVLVLGEMINLLECVFGPSFLSSVISPYLLEPFVLQLKVLILPVLELWNLLSDSWARMKMLLQCSRLKCSLPCPKALSCAGLGGLGVCQY